MNTRRRCLPQFAIASLALITASAVAAEPAAATQTRGVTAREIAAVDLGGEIEGMSGRALRTRIVTIEPGGVFAAHNHVDRPGTVYVLQGAVTEHRNGVTRTFGPGETWSENGDTTHWLENAGMAPAVLIAVDILKR